MSALNNLIKEFEHPRAFEMKFMELYNKTLLTCKEEQPYPTDFTRPSSLGKCARNIFFERTHAPKDPIDLNNPWIYNSVGILESGTDRHERIQNVLFKMEEQGFIKNIDIPTAIKDAQAKGIKSEFVKWNEDKTEARCCNTEYNLYFQADGLVELDNKKAVFEIKTVSCKKLASIRKSQKPLPPHILQATAYAMCLGVDYILFFRLEAHGDALARKVCAQLRALRLGYLRDYLQFAVGIASHQTGSACRVDALAPVGVGHGDGHGVFDDVAAGPHLRFFGQAAKGFARHGGGIGNGDGLGAAHGGTKMLFENISVGSVARICLLHCGTLLLESLLMVHYHCAGLVSRVFAALAQTVEKQYTIRAYALVF